MSVATIKFSTILLGFSQVLKIEAGRSPNFAARVREHDLVAQIVARDEEIGRWFEFQDGTITLAQRHSCRSRRDRLHSRTRRSARSC